MLLFACETKKKVYDENLQQYIDYKQSIWFISDKELRLKAELESICKEIPLEERNQYCRNKSKIKRYNLSKDYIIQLKPRSIYNSLELDYLDNDFTLVFKRQRQGGIAP